MQGLVNLAEEFLFYLKTNGNPNGSHLSRKKWHDQICILKR